MFILWTLFQLHLEKIVITFKIFEPTLSYKNLSEDENSREAVFRDAQLMLGGKLSFMYLPFLISFVCHNRRETINSWREHKNFVMAATERYSRPSEDSFVYRTCRNEWIAAGRLPWCSYDLCALLWRPVRQLHCCKVLWDGRDFVQGVNYYRVSSEHYKHCHKQFQVWMIKALFLCQIKLAERTILIGDTYVGSYLSCSHSRRIF